MHHYITLLVAALMLATPLTCTAAMLVEPDETETPITAIPILSEVVPNPASGKEWVELYNPASSTIDLAGWKLCDNRATSCTIATLSGSIEAGQWLTVYLSSSVLNNDGDSVLLKDPSGQVVDQTTYGSAGPVPKKGQSLIWTENAWKISLTPTPDAENLLTEPATPIEEVKTAFSPPLKSASETKTTTAPTKTTPPPPPQYLAWKLDVPSLAIRGEKNILSVASTADKRGGNIFFTWRFLNELYEGGTIHHHFTTSGLQTVFVAASSTSHTTGTYQFTIPVVEPTTTPIIISEVAPDDHEFVELYNAGASSTDISNWKMILTSGDTFTFASGTILAPGAYRVFYQEATGLNLVNSTSTIYLLNSTTTLADTITYPKIIDKKSYQRDGLDWDWREPSPGTPPPTPEPTILGEKIISLAKTTTTKPTPTYARLSIAQAREEPNKTKVTITGRVGVLPGIFSTQSWYLTDTTGGIAIFRADKNFPKLSVGQHVTVAGEHSTQNTIPRLKAERFSVGTTSTLAAVSTTIAAASEQPGQLVTITGEITKRLKTQMYLNDPDDEILVTIKTNTGITTSNYALGDRARITGIIEQTTRGPELWPRSPDDITILTSTPQHTMLQTEKQTHWLPLIGLVSATLLGLVIYKNKKHLD